MGKIFVAIFMLFSFAKANDEVITSSTKPKTKIKILYEAYVKESNQRLFYVKNFEALRKKRGSHKDIAIVKFEDNKQVKYINVDGDFWKLKNINNIGKYPSTSKKFFRSCLSILKKNPNAKSGFFTIDIDADDQDEAFKVYCDMKTDGGGWTRFLRYKDSIAFNKVNMKKQKKFVSNGYKISLEQSKMGYTDLLLNGCKSNKSTMIISPIPPLIITDWIESNAKNGVIQTPYVNSCLKIALAKDGKTYFYGTDLSHEKEFETIHFSTKCKKYVNGASTTVWGAVDAGNSYRRIWGSVNGIDHKWSNDMRYHNDYICAYVR